MATGNRSLFDHSRYDGEAHLVGPVPRLAIRPRPDATHPATSALKPAWTLLYALLPLCLALLTLVDCIPLSGGLHSLAQGLIVVLVVGLAAVWVRANRRALSGIPSDSEVEAGPPDVRVEVHHPSPQVIHLGTRRSRTDT
jgi:hypothetical protein